MHERLLKNNIGAREGASAVVIGFLCRYGVLGLGVWGTWNYNTRPLSSVAEQCVHVRELSLIRHSLKRLEKSHQAITNPPCKTTINSTQTPLTEAVHTPVHNTNPSLWWTSRTVQKRHSSGWQRKNSEKVQERQRKLEKYLIIINNQT